MVASGVQYIFGGFIERFFVYMCAVYCVVFLFNDAFGWSFFFVLVFLFLVKSGRKKVYTKHCVYGFRTRQSNSNHSAGD